MSYFPLEFTDHVREKMQLRAVSKEEVFQIVRNPEVVTRGDRHALMRGNLTVVLEPNGKRWRVITILLREQEQWSDADARNRQ